jgi:hypothetical protein
MLSDMSLVREFTVSICNRDEIRDFIENWHYSKSINGVKSDYCFKLIHGNKIIGACIYGKLAMANVWKKYVDDENDLLELRRLCCIDDTPKNTESYFIGHTLRWLKKNTDVKKILSYADLTYGHEGIIYKATNFKFLGQTKTCKMIKYNGRLYHDKTIRTKYKGELKPFAARIKEALLNQEAYYIKTKPKNIYLMELK